LRPQGSRLNITAQQPLQQLVQQASQQSPIKQSPIKPMPQQFDPLQSTLNRAALKLFDSAPSTMNLHPPSTSGSRFFNFN